LENGIVKTAKFGFIALLVALVGSQPFVTAQAGKKDPSVVPDWGQFRGPKRDGVSTETGLLKEWPKAGPTLVWKATGVGQAMSSVSVVGNKVFTMGDGMMLALDAATGKVLWKTMTGDTGQPGATQGGPGPRCTPASDGTLVIGLFQHGTLVCLQAATGKEMWKHKMSEYGGNTPGWGYSESPLLDGGMVLVSPGGTKGAVVALNKMTGAMVWQATQVKDQPHYTSLITAEIGKVPQYLYFSQTGVFGVSKAGQLLWKGECEGKTAVCSSPVVKDNFVFVSCGYNVGSHGFQISTAGNQFKAQQIYADPKVLSHHGGAVLVGDHVYGAFENGMMCIEIKTGKIAWQDRGVGKGSIAAADGMLYCRSEKGAVALAEASPDGYKEHGRFEQPERSKMDSWPNIVVYGGKMYLRDEDVLLCYNVSAK
jgi:outer membrane protein assembly factor BamB